MPKGKPGEHEPMLDMGVQPPGHRACSGGPHWAPEADFLYDKPRAGKLMAATCRHCRERSRLYQLERKAYYKMKPEGEEMEQELNNREEEEDDVGEDHGAQSSAPDQHNDEPERSEEGRENLDAEAADSTLETNPGDALQQENEVTEDRAGTRHGDSISSGQDKVRQASDYEWDYSLLDVGKGDTTEHEASNPGGRDKTRPTSNYEWDYSLLDIGAGSTAEHADSDTSGREKSKTTSAYEWDFSLLDIGTGVPATGEAQVTSEEKKTKTASDYEWDYSLLDIGTGAPTKP